MPLQGIDGKQYGWCAICKEELPTKNLRRHLNKAHSMVFIPGCPSCFYFRDRWTDVTKHCRRQHNLDIEEETGKCGVLWGLTKFDSQNPRSTYCLVQEEDICLYPLCGEKLSPRQIRVISQATFNEPTNSHHDNDVREKSCWSNTPKRNSNCPKTCSHSPCEDTQSNSPENYHSLSKKRSRKSSERPDDNCMPPMSTDKQLSSTGVSEANQSPHLLVTCRSQKSRGISLLSRSVKMQKQWSTKEVVRVESEETAPSLDKSTTLEPEITKVIIYQDPSTLPEIIQHATSTKATQTELHLDPDDVVLVVPKGGGRLKFE